MILSDEAINRWSENIFYYMNSWGCRNYGYADIRVLCLLTFSQTTNVELFESEKVFEDNFEFDDNDENFPRRVENLWEKEKLIEFFLQVCCMRICCKGLS